MMLVPKLGFSLFPENDSPYFLVDIELPQGSAVSETDRAVLFADGVLAAEPQFVWRFANTGRGNPQIYYNVIPEEQQSNVGSIYVRFDHWESVSGHATLEALRAKLKDVPGRALQRAPFRKRPADRSADCGARARPRHSRADRNRGGRRTHSCAPHRGRATYRIRWRRDSSTST